MTELMDLRRGDAADPVLGIEVHVELGTTTRCSTPPPTSVATNTVTPCPGCCPAGRHKAVEYAIKIGLALVTRSRSTVSRVELRYPDLTRPSRPLSPDRPIAHDGRRRRGLRTAPCSACRLSAHTWRRGRGQNTHIGGADGRIQGADHSAQWTTTDAGVRCWRS